MKKEEEIALKVTKEIVVKFIEVGRLSVSSFKEVWNQVYSTVIKSADPEKTKSTKKQG